MNYFVIKNDQGFYFTGKGMEFSSALDYAKKYPKVYLAQAAAYKLVHSNGYKGVLRIFLVEVEETEITDWDV